jgi:hypothetical protein
MAGRGPSKKKRPSKFSCYGCEYDPTYAQQKLGIVCLNESDCLGRQVTYSIGTHVKPSEPVSYSII